MKALNRASDLITASGNGSLRKSNGPWWALEHEGIVSTYVVRRP